MRGSERLKYNLAAGLDGFAARADGSFDWLSVEGLDGSEFAAAFESFDAILMGRKTCELILGELNRRD